MGDTRNHIQQIGIHAARVEDGHKKAQKAQNVIKAAALHLRFLCFIVATLGSLLLDLLNSGTKPCAYLSLELCLIVF